jgi:hypothetical protein
MPISPVRSISTISFEYVIPTVLAVKVMDRTVWSGFVNIFKVFLFNGIAIILRGFDGINKIPSTILKP